MKGRQCQKACQILGSLQKKDGVFRIRIKSIFKQSVLRQTVCIGILWAFIFLKWDNVFGQWQYALVANVDNILASVQRPRICSESCSSGRPEHGLVLIHIFHNGLFRFKCPNRWPWRFSTSSQCGGNNRKVWSIEQYYWWLSLDSSRFRPATGTSGVLRKIYTTHSISL